LAQDQNLRGSARGGTAMCAVAREVTSVARGPYRSRCKY
jgi:hypothetical protein